MTNDLKQQLARLRTLSLPELRERYLEAFGEPTRAGNKDFLVKRIAWRLQSLAEGSLSERARQRAGELARDADLRTTIPRPRTTTTPSAQPQVHAARFSQSASMPLPGTLLTRQYRGRTIAVTVLPKGFEHDGTVHRSLSAVAKAVTGSHWNGKLFFGLAKGAGQ